MRIWTEIGIFSATSSEWNSNLWSTTFGRYDDHFIYG